MTVNVTPEQEASIRRKWDQSDNGLTYEQFRNSVQPTFGCDGAVTVKWCGMWLCIETDGYCHS